MALKSCPTCHSTLRAPFIACDYCSWTATGKSSSSRLDEETAERNAVMVAEARQAAIDSAPASEDLTEQQWYNVCKFWPFVAVHCKRARPIVGPDHPLDATAREGPLTRALPRRIAAAERAQNAGELIE